MIKQEIVIKKEINASVDRVFEAFVNEDDLKEWYRSTNDWSTPYAHVDLREGGKLKIRFEDPKKFNSFDYEGEFTKIEKPNLLEYKLNDDRNVKIEITKDGDKTLVKETFTVEPGQDVKLQAEGWESILNHLKDYLEK